MTYSETTKAETEKAVKRTVKDSVFSDFFGISDNLLKLYQTLHPEDTDTVVEDLKDIKESHLIELNIKNPEDRMRLLSAAENLLDEESKYV